MVESMVVTLLAVTIGILASDNDPIILPKCRGPNVQLCANAIGCIHKDWMCDGRRDCQDGSDEEPQICSLRSRQFYQAPQGKQVSVSLGRCPSTWFFCKDASACVEPARVCDYRKDCRDGSDESSFCTYIQIEQHRTEADGIVH